MNNAIRFLFVSVAVLFLSSVCLAQGASKKTYTFRGKVVAVKESARSLTVNGEEIKGWMGAMTMDYKVDDPAILKIVKVGDQISATVYDGDYILHKVQVTPKAADGSKSKN